MHLQNKTNYIELIAISVLVWRFSSWKTSTYKILLIWLAMQTLQTESPFGTLPPLKGRLLFSTCAQLVVFVHI